MTDAEWNACADPTPMMRFLNGKASDRKMRLFAVACCRRVWPLFGDDADRNAVEIAERFADGAASEEERKAARDASRKSDNPYCTSALGPWGDCMTAYTSVAATLAVSRDGEVTADEWTGRLKGGFTAASRAEDVARFTSDALGFAACERLQKAARANVWRRIHYTAQRWFWEPPEVMEHCHTRYTEKAQQAGLLRDNFANPIHPVAFDPAWLAWNEGTVRKLAHVIYDDRAFDRLPLLADALEDAGCSDAAILAHCREPGEHVRGCWVVDLLLGKA